MWMVDIARYIHLYIYINTYIYIYIHTYGILIGAIKSCTPRNVTEALLACRFSFANWVGQIMGQRGRHMKQIQTEKQNRRRGIIRALLVSLHIFLFANISGPNPASFTRSCRLTRGLDMGVLVQHQRHQQVRREGNLMPWQWLDNGLMWIRSSNSFVESYLWGVRWSNPSSPPQASCWWKPTRFTGLESRKRPFIIAQW